MKISHRKLTRFRKRVAAFFGRKWNVHFLHIRKTGGTSIKSALERSQTTSSAVIQMHPHRVKLRHISRGEKVMFVVRDPVERYISGFLSRYRQGAPAHTVPWNEREADAFARFDTPERLALALDSAHEQYAEAAEAMGAVSHLAARQWDWVGDESVFQRRWNDFLWIARQETLAADFQALKRALGLPDEVELPGGERATNRASGGSKDAGLSAEAALNVRRWYARDYRLLELCEQWREDSGGAARAPKR